MKNRAYCSRLAALGICFLATVGIFLGSARPARAQLTSRFATDDRGNFVLFGNTTGLDCRDSVTEKPIVGTVPQGPTGLYSCRGLLPDTSRGDDVLWRSDEPTSGSALASALITPASARSTAVLSLPAGARVVYARLYWAGQRVPLLGAGKSVVVARPGVFSSPVTADALAGSSTFLLNLLSYYQSSADITRLVQTYGSGAYRISGIDTVELALQQADTLFIGWTVVVFYNLASDPPRNLALFDGFERVSTGGAAQTTLNVGGITAPAAAVGGQLGIVAYGGNSDIVGDQLQVNGTALSNTQNPANNFFNRTSTVLGAAGPRAGDLPQFSGRPGSISGLDIDVVDISSTLTPGATSFSVVANTTADSYFVGSIATAVTTVRPILSGTTKAVANLTRQDGRFLPGDVLAYTITTQNTGNDVGTDVLVRDVLPANVTFVSGSINVLTGANTGAKTDQPADDQGEYNAATRTITVRLGTGANATTGGTLAVGATSSVRFQVTINNGATGTVSNQATISTIGSGSTTPMTWPTGNGQQPGQPTVITITTCASNADCSPQAPFCDTTAVPPQCICRGNADCPGTMLCNPLTRQCAECLPLVTTNCNPNTTGGACLLNLMCGCLTNADCAGRACDILTGTCAAISTDLSLALTRAPAGMMVAPGTALTYQLVVTNKGPAAVTGAQLDTGLSPATPVTWTCASSGGAQCPAASGTGALLTLPALPVGGALMFTYSTAAASDPASSAVDFTATIAPPRGFQDTNPTDNTVTDSVLVGLLPGGPDLTVTVDEEKSPTDSSVTYTINVTDNGPGPAAGVTVTYQVPGDATVELLGGDGWSCALQGREVICTRTAPIEEGQTATIKLVTHATGDQTSVPLQVTVTATDPAGNSLTDPNPADNQVDRVTDLERFRLFGGGLSCTFSPGAGPLGGAAGAGLWLAALMALALVRRRARS